MNVGKHVSHSIYVPTLIFGYIIIITFDIHFRRTLFLFKRSWFKPFPLYMLKTACCDANYNPCISAVVVAVQSIVTAIACAVASDVIHVLLITRVLRAPMAFFDTTPLGRILNRFSQDMNAVDVNIRLNLAAVFRGITALATTVLAISYSTPIFIAVLLPIGVGYYFLQVIRKGLNESLPLPVF